MNRVDEFIRVGGDDRERANPFLGLGSCTVLPNAREREWLTALNADIVRLLWATFDRPPFEKVLDWSVQQVSVNEGRAIGSSGATPTL